MSQIPDQNSQASAHYPGAKYASMLQSSRDFAIIGTDLNGVITEWNAGARYIFGWSGDDIIGKTVTMIFTPEDRAAGADKKEMLIAAETGRAADIRWHLRADGSRFWAAGELIAVRDSEGALQGYVKLLRDETSLNNASGALRASETSEQRYRELLRSMEVGFCILEMMFDPDGRAVDYRFLETNLAFEENTGLKNAIGRTARELVPDLEQEWVDVYAQVASSHTPRRFESGSEAMGRWFDVYAIPIDAANTSRLALIFHDLTERRRSELALRSSEAALRESEERFRNIADHSPLMMWVTDPEGQATYLNRSWYEFTGQREEEALGLGWLEAVHADDQGWSGETFLACNANQETFRLEYRLRRHDGDYRWAVDAASPRFGGDGTFLGYVGSVLDIQDQKDAQDALRSQNISLQSEVATRTTEVSRLWDASPDLLLVIDFDGVFLRVNPAWTTMLGYTDEELVGQHVTAFVIPEDHAETIKAYKLAAEGGRPSVVNRYLHKDGTLRWISWVAAPLGNVTYATGRDITAEKAQAEALARTEEALRQSQKMEAVGQLTGGLAHDFNNLLAGISGSLDMMQIRIQQGRAAEIDRYMVGAQGAAKRAAALTHRLLAFSRRQTLDPKPTDVNRLVAGMKDLIQRTVGPEIIVDSGDSAGLWPTLVDPNQLENALLNLCINARDAMPHGGTITIEATNHRLDERSARERDLQPGHYVSLCVSDTGTGMTPDVINKAFDPFFTTKPIGVGTGLGLSMIYGFARQSGGQVRITSEVGEGATVCIYIPRHHSEEAMEKDADPSPVLTGEPGRTVLVVDDEPLVRMLVVDVVEELGHIVIEAGDGPQALNALRSNSHIDLLITDVGLPNGMNGRQVADAAREIHPDLKVMFVTGYAENAVLSHGHLAPGMQIVTKPFDMQVLSNRIHEMLNDDLE
ncbi:PAS domain S-box protein [Aureimonas fodinaquatilis]|nr:PAS domain S-box protein [Aureimonas fodinaquatilis]